MFSENPVRASKWVTCLDGHDPGAQKLNQQVKDGPREPEDMPSHHGEGCVLM